MVIGSKPLTAGSLFDSLPESQREVVELILHGQTLSMIADKQKVSILTVSSRRMLAYRKLGINSRDDLARLASATGFCESPKLYQPSCLGEWTKKTAEYIAWSNVAKAGRHLLCDRWQDYKNFLVDMGRKPSPDAKLRRRDRKSLFCPENCYWKTTPTPEEAAASRREYLEKAKARAKQYREKNPDAMRSWRNSNKEHIRNYGIEYRNQNEQRCKALGRAWYEINKDRLRLTSAARHKQWRSRNPQRFRATQHNYRARKRGSEGSHSPEDIQHLFEVQKGRCSACKSKFKRNPGTGMWRYHIDHVMPLVRGGTNDPGNIQLLCSRCNASKNDMHPDEWARKLGKLFC